MTKTRATIRIPEEAFYIEGIQLAKRGIAADIQRFFPKIAKLEFVETFMNPKAATTTVKKKPTVKRQKTKSKKRPPIKKTKKK
jgi:hypothetical protein